MTRTVASILFNFMRKYRILTTLAHKGTVSGTTLFYLQDAFVSKSCERIHETIAETDMWVDGGRVLFGDGDEE